MYSLLTQVTAVLVVLLGTVVLVLSFFNASPVSELCPRIESITDTTLHCNH